MFTACIVRRIRTKIYNLYKLYTQLLGEQLGTFCLELENLQQPSDSSITGTPKPKPKPKSKSKPKSMPALNQVVWTALFKTTSNKIQLWKNNLKSRRKILGHLTFLTHVRHNTFRQSTNPIYLISDHPNQYSVLWTAWTALCSIKTYFPAVINRACQF